MSAETKVKSGSANVRVAQYKARVGEFVDSRRGKMFGVAEVAGLAGSCLILLLVLLSYLYFLVPARSRVTSLTSDNKQLKTNLETLAGVARNQQNTTTTVHQITTSLGKFVVINEVELQRARDTNAPRTAAQMSFFFSPGLFKSTSAIGYS